jgi:hypothetical protein
MMTSVGGAMGSMGGNPTSTLVGLVILIIVVGIVIWKAAL